MYKVWGQYVYYGLVTNEGSALLHTLDVKSAAKVQKYFKYTTKETGQRRDVHVRNGREMVAGLTAKRKVRTRIQKERAQDKESRLNQLFNNLNLNENGKS